MTTTEPHQSGRESALNERSFKEFVDTFLNHNIKIKNNLFCLSELALDIYSYMSASLTEIYVCLTEEGDKFTKFKN